MKYIHIRRLLTGLVLAGGALWLLNAAAGCDGKGRMAYQRGMRLLQGQEYQPALEAFREARAADPDSVLALYGEARCLYELHRSQEALPLFEEFLLKTDSLRAQYSDERFDAEFYRDKCKQELGMEVPQNQENIPPPPMGE